MPDFKKMFLILVFAAIGINLPAQENGFTFRPFFGGIGVFGVIGDNEYGIGGTYSIVF